MSGALALRLTEAAEADLAEIWSYLALEASETIATQFVTAIATRFEPLRRMPHLGPARDQLGPGLCVTFHKAYAIYYRPLTEALAIVRVLHGARDVAAIAEHGGFSEP